MTSKDYIAIANQLRKAYEPLRKDYETARYARERPAATINGFVDAVKAITLYLETSNGRFDRTKFGEAIFGKDENPL